MTSFERMRVLYVNWVDYLDAEARGGGVSIYQRNLMTAQTEATFLACGTSYDLARTAPRWEAIRHGPKTDHARRFEIVNSGVMGPGHFSFGNPRQISDPATTETFFDFLTSQGPFDVVHFNNLEGLPAEALGLKAVSPDTRVILSLHNYYPFCPQVNLWQQERRSCDDFKDGSACVSCLPVVPNPALLRPAAGLAYGMKCAGFEPGSIPYDLTLRSAMSLGRRGVRALRVLRGRKQAGTSTSVSLAEAAAFAARRMQMVSLINGHCDRVLCVSDAVRQIALAHGLDPQLCHTSYIGTAEAEAWARSAPRPFPCRDDGTLCLAYLGYMRRDKGFPFLLGALEALPKEVAARLRLRVAARRGDRETMHRLERLRGRMADLIWQDGYRHDDLDGLLEKVDIGLIPVLWHDCLPQVAIEMHARHIPLLCADMGGARELSGSAEMVFAAGDTDAFAARLSALLAGQIDMQTYWAQARPPRTMQDHLAELQTHYTT